MADSPFLIAGGGIAGLAAGLGLARIGKSSHIFEKAPSFDEIGAGLQLGPNAVRALQWLGAWDAVAPHCVAPSEIHVRDGVTGNILQRLPLGAEFEKRFGAPYRVAHRADLQSALLESVRSRPGIRLHTDAEVTDVSIAETTLSVKSGRTFAGQAIIAADGVHSKIRKCLFGSSERISTGHTLNRALIPISGLPSSINTDVVTLWLMPGCHVVHYAVADRKLFNVVISFDSNALTRVTRFFRSHYQLADLLAYIPAWSEWPAIDFDPMPNWCRNRTVLIGDAAHASLPYLAQGAAMALEDACVLSNAMQGTNDFESAFRDFAKSRFTRTSAIQRRSRQIGKIYHAGGVLRQVRNAVLKATPSQSFINRLSWIYEWKFGGK